MTIEVTGCHDCPFSQCDYEGNLEYWCGHFRFPGTMNVNDHYEGERLHPSCPLKQETIKIKLKEENSYNCVYRGEHTNPPFA